MNKIIIILSLISLILIAGCNVERRSMDSNYKVECQQVCLSQNLTYEFTGVTTNNYFCNCVKKISFTK